MVRGAWKGLRRVSVAVADWEVVVCWGWVGVVGVSGAKKTRESMCEEMDWGLRRGMRMSATRMVRLTPRAKSMDWGVLSCWMPREWKVASSNIAGLRSGG
jgi:hypothetical protein